MAFGDLIQSDPAEGGAGFDASLTATFSTATPVEGNLLVAVVARQNNGGMTSVTDGDLNAFSLAVEIDDPEADPPNYVGIWYRIAGASQSTSVIMTPAASDLIAMAIAEFEGPFEASPLDKTATGEADSTTTVTSGTTATTAQADEVAVCGFTTAPISAPGLDNSFTLDEFVEHTAGSATRPYVQLGHRVYTTTAAAQTDSSWTGTSVNAVGAIATFKKQAVAGGQAGVGGGLVSGGLAGGRGRLAR